MQFKPTLFKSHLYYLLVVQRYFCKRERGKIIYKGRNLHVIKADLREKLKSFPCEKLCKNPSKPSIRKEA